MEIPDFLMSQVREGKVVLLLGAGASIGATNSAAEPPPTSKQLAELLAKKYLGGFHRDNSLAVVAELAISAKRGHPGGARRELRRHLGFKKDRSSITHDSSSTDIGKRAVIALCCPCAEGP